MSNQKIFLGTNPFMPIPKELAPSVAETDYHKKDDEYIIEYAEVEHVKQVGEKDTEFVIETTIEEVSRVSRQEYINSYAPEVGILNIIEKVRKTGDMSLLNQVSRSILPSHEKDSLGRPVEDIVDITGYQVDRMDALNGFKKGASSFDALPDDLKGKLSMSDIAHLSDAEIDQYLNAVKQKIIASRKEVKDESSK